MARIQVPVTPRASRDELLGFDAQGRLARPGVEPPTTSALSLPSGPLRLRVELASGAATSL